MSAHRSVRRRHAKRFIYQITYKQEENRKMGVCSHRLVVGCPISGGAYVQRAPAPVWGRNRGSRRRLARVREPRRPPYQVLKPQQMQPANRDGLTGKRCHKLGPHTWRVIVHLSDCSGWMVFCFFGGSTHGRAESSRPPHQLLASSEVGRSFPLEGDLAPPRCGEEDRPRLRFIVAATRESASTRDGEGLRIVDPVELTRRRYSMPPVSGEEDKGVVRFEDIDGFKGDDIFVVDDSEDEL